MSDASLKLAELIKLRDDYSHRLKLMHMTLHPERYKTFLGFSSYGPGEGESERQWARRLKREIAVTKATLAEIKSSIEKVHSELLGRRAEASDTRNEEPCYTPYDDYHTIVVHREVRWGKKRLSPGSYPLRPLGAAAFSELEKAWKDRSPGRRQSAILIKIESKADRTVGRLIDVFREPGSGRISPLWNTLVIPGRGSGIRRLNLPDLPPT